ncbi:MAG: PAS domain S-box protein [Deltaproteobacteria bacterium]|nr:PAS domain S-box protein [Deltaproteobacteria bacterium]
MDGDSKEEIERLSAENEELRIRLDEAEQALEAIRTGQVESLVVEGPDGPRIFSLEGTDHSYRVLVEGMKDGAATLAEDGTVLYCNAHFAEMLEAPLESVMGGSVHRFLPEYSVPAFQALVREATGEAGRGELDLLAANGQLLPAHVSVAVIHEGTTRRYCLVAADLRAQKRSEQILLAERLARSVLEQAAEAIVVCDEHGRVTRASTAAIEMCGRNPLLLSFDEAFPIAPGFAAEILQGKTLRGAEATLRHADGSTMQVLVSAVALRGAQGEPIGCVVNLVDITERSRAQRAIQESEGRFRAVLDGSQDVIYRVDLKADRYEYISPSCQSVVDFTADELMAMKSEDALSMIHPDDLPAMQSALAQLLENGQAAVEYRQRTRAGGYRWLSNRMSLVRDSQGQPLYRNGNIRDVTERKQAEEALREADRNKSHFLAVLSHELRNPLAPIRNSLYILDRAVPGGEQAQRAKSIIDRQVAHMARLIDDLLDVTRISSGKVQLQLELLDLRELVRRTAEDFRPAFDAAGVSLEVSLGDRLLAVRADRTRISQVVGNLLHNATKFATPGGRAWLTTESDPDQRFAVILVRDNGAGISEDMLARMFQPFAQADKTLDRSQGGLGLGLSLVKSLVEMHGGSVSASSLGPNQGAEIAVRLPLEGARLQKGPAHHGPVPTAHSRRVLVIEDNSDAAESLKEVLELHAHTVAIAHSAREGLAKARKFAPQVVLCDIGLPDMDGYEVARAFRSDPELRSAFLVAVSGYAAPEDLEAAKAAGFDRHLAKPPSVDAIEDLIRAAG